ncbi:MAG TPA: hypothetical protein VE130_02340 [Nitrososphaeraceae archaeon]|nr:hypothetical protein [Nitrososphaeraceae archaeon]
MSESAQGGSDNINETLMQTNQSAASAEPESNQSGHQDEIEITLKEFDEKLRDNDRSIKRIEESIIALYDRLDRTFQAKGSRVQSNKRSKKDSELEKKSKKEKKLDKKGKKKGEVKGNKKTKPAKAITTTESKKRTNSKNQKGRLKNAGKRK